MGKVNQKMGKKKKICTEAEKKTQFKPGHPGGPGRPPIPTEYKEAWAMVKAIKQEGAIELSAAFQKVRHMGIDELKAFIGTKDKPAAPNTNVVELLAARALMRALSTGKDITVIIESLCGVEPKQIEITGKDGAPLNPFGKYTEQQLHGVFTALDAIVKENRCKLIQSSQSQSESSASSHPSSPTESGKA